MPARVPRPHTDEWQQLKQYCLWPEQRAYELLRPIVLFGDVPAERAEQTGEAERTLRRDADQFDAQGMRSLFRPTSKQQHDTHRSLPPPIRHCIVDLKVEYAGLSLREIATNCYVRFGRTPSPNTVKQVLTEGPAATVTTRRYPRGGRAQGGME